MLLLLCALALADPPDEDDDPYTIVVIGEKSSKEAHRDLGVTLEKLGYNKTGVDAQGREIWEVGGARPTVLVKDGMVELRDHMVTRTVDPVTGAIAAGALSPRQAAILAATVLDALAGPLAAWRDAIAREAVIHRMLRLDERLRAVWERGQAADGRYLAESAARRGEILRMWLDTSDSDSGARVRERIREYVTDHVNGPNGFSADELAKVDGAPFPDTFLDPVANAELAPPKDAPKNRCLAGKQDCVFPLQQTYHPDW